MKGVAITTFTQAQFAKRPSYAKMKIRLGKLIKIRPLMKARFYKEPSIKKISRKA